LPENVAEVPTVARLTPMKESQIIHCEQGSLQSSLNSLVSDALMFLTNEDASGTLKLKNQHHDLTNLFKSDADGRDWDTSDSDECSFSDASDADPLTSCDWLNDTETSLSDLSLMLRDFNGKAMAGETHNTKPEALKNPSIECLKYKDEIISLFGSGPPSRSGAQKYRDEIISLFGSPDMDF
jgi:hypothetical protein